MGLCPAPAQTVLRWARPARGLPFRVPVLRALPLTWAQ